MASPFTIFRRHQKVMIAVLGVLAMFAFVFLPIIMKTDDSPTQVNAVVVQTKKYGDLRQSDLARLIRERRAMVGFLTRVHQAVVEAQGKGTMIESFVNVLGNSSEQSVVDTWLRVQDAKRLGMQVSDEAINQFIKQLTEDRVPTHELKTILKNAEIGQLQLFEMMRHELLAMRLQETFFTSLGGTTPAQRWDYYNRLKRMATVEVVPVPAANFLADVKDPDEKTLLAFFEENKDKYASPYSPEPGFREPHRIAVNYLKAEYAKFLSPSTVTDEEVRQQYEKKKDLYDQVLKNSVIQPPATTTEGAETKTPETTEKAPATTEKTPEATEKTPEATEKAPEAAEKTPDAMQETPPAAEKAPETTEETPKAAEKSPENAEPMPEAAQKDSSQGEPPTTPQDAPAAAPGEKQPAESSDKTSSVESESPFKLATFLQEKSADPKTAASDATAPAAGQPAAPMPAGETAPPVAGAEPAAGSTPPAEGGAAAMPEPTIEPTPQTPPGTVATQPGGEKKDDIVSGMIGQVIRRQVAYERTQAVITEVQDKVQAYLRKRTVTKANQAPGAEKVDLAKLDEEFAKSIATLGGEKGLVFGRTPPVASDVPRLMSQFEATDYEIGRTFIDNKVPFTDFAFVENRPLYVTAMAMDNDGNYYLFWKVEDAAQRIPKLEDPGVKAQVVRAWKMQKARQLAVEAAKELAAKARKQDALLKDSIGSLPGVKVAESKPFSWMTYGAVPTMTSPRTPPRLTDLSPTVELAGPDFMRAVFSLKKGEVGTAVNHPETIAYVVRVTEMNPSENVLWAQFESDNYATYAEIARGDQFQMVRAWQKELVDDAGLKWLQKPDESQEQPEQE